jgi:hypothetical protein
MLARWPLKTVSWLWHVPTTVGAQVERTGSSRRASGRVAEATNCLIMSFSLAEVAPYGEETPV